MGGEFIFFGAAIIGVCVLVFLCFRACIASARPYALPTFLFSSAIGIWMAWGKTFNNYAIFFFIGFLGGAIVFGAHAELIRILLSHSQCERPGELGNPPRQR
jgi:hypothetical protein